MGRKVGILRSLPVSARDVQARKNSKDIHTVSIARKFGCEYFDGDRKYGYGGYYNDCRWVTVARDIIQYYGLDKGSKVLDVGCAKGFLVHEMCKQGMDAYGVDISDYALASCDDSIVGRLHKGSAADLSMFKVKGFDLVLSINTLHNLEEQHVIKSLSKIQALSREPSFVSVDAYLDEAGKQRLEDWVLTAQTYGTPEFWLDIFSRAGYTGDYAWTIV